MLIILEGGITMRCKKSDGSGYTTVTWRYFYPQCNRILQALGICSARRGAFLPASAVCQQSLYV